MNTAKIKATNQREKEANKVHSYPPSKVVHAAEQLFQILVMDITGSELIPSAIKTDGGDNKYRELI